MMAATLDLTPKPFRNIGLTQKNPYDSLHRPKLQASLQARARTPEDVNAPPISSSDDDSVADGEGAGAGVLDDSPLEGGKSETNRHTFREVSSPNTEIYKDPADILPTVWASSKESGSWNGSQSSQKRKKDVVDEDEDEDLFGRMLNLSQSKRRKTPYGGSSQHNAQKNTSSNIHLGPTTKGGTKPAKKTKVPETKSAKHPLRTLRGQDAAMAIGMSIVPAESCETDVETVDKLDQAEGQKGRNIPSNETTPRSQRASQRSSGTTQGSSQASPKKGFKKPRKLSPKKAAPTKHKFGLSPRSIPVPAAKADTGRPTRSSASVREALVLADPDDFPAERPPNTADVERFALSSEIQDAANLAKEKLGLLVTQYKPPPSSKTASSLPSADHDDASSTSALSSPPSASPDTSPTQRTIEYMMNVTVFSRAADPPNCPVCKEEVDREFLKEYTGNKWLNIRQQAQFCKAHKKRTAELEWEKGGYPGIDWHHFDERLKEYHDTLDDILQRRRSSFYRNAFEDVMKSGKERTLHKNMMNEDELEELTPGYYGSRGASMMCVFCCVSNFIIHSLITSRVENIMSRFSLKLRRLTATDKLISSGGISSYVQAVLVPELAVLLVKDDMSVDDERARNILRDSANVGNILNEEEDEVIRDPDLDEKVVVEVI